VDCSRSSAMVAPQATPPPQLLRDEEAAVPPPCLKAGVVGSSPVGVAPLALPVDTGVPDACPIER
jgi:hypothetical protein